MSDLLLEHLLLTERWEWETLTSRQHRNQSTPFLLPVVEGYLDLTNNIVFKSGISVSAPLDTFNGHCTIGTILLVKKQYKLVMQNVPFVRDARYFNNDTLYWVQVNWWITPQTTVRHIKISRIEHVAYPEELVNMNLVMWVPATFIHGIVSIFSRG